MDHSGQNWLRPSASGADARLSEQLVGNVCATLGHIRISPESRGATFEGAQRATIRHLLLFPVIFARVGLSKAAAVALLAPPLKAVSLYVSLSLSFASHITRNHVT